MIFSRLFYLLLLSVLFLANRVDAQTNPEMYVLSIGISDYKDNTHIRDLKYSKDDALAIANAFSTQKDYYKIKKVITLVDSMATREGILNAFDQFPTVKPDALFVLFFSGHGAVGSICPHDFDYDGYFNDPDRFVLTENVLDNKLKKLACNFIIIYDACHSGSMVDKGFDEDDEGKGGVLPPKVEAWLKEKGEKLLKAFEGTNKMQMVIGSSASNQKSYEWSPYKHGFLTQALLDAFLNNSTFDRDGLEFYPDYNNNGFVSMLELQNYLFEAVVYMTGEANKKNKKIKHQIPIIKTISGSDLSLLFVGTPKNIDIVREVKPDRPEVILINPNPPTKPNKKHQITLKEDIAPEIRQVPQIPITSQTAELPPLCDDTTKWKHGSGSAFATLKISTTLNCCLRVDCQIADSFFSAGRIIRVPFRKGTYRLDFTSFENPADRIVFNYVPQKSDIDEVYIADLKKIRDQRVEIEQAKAEQKRLFKKAIQDGEKARSEQNFDQAILEFEYALQIYPGDVDASIKRTATRQEKAEAEEINQQFLTATEQGDQQFAAKEFEAAVLSFQQALSLKPGNPAATQSLKTAKMELEFKVAMDNADKKMDSGDFEAAMVGYKSALHVKKEEPRATQQLKKAEVEYQYNMNMKEGKANMNPNQYVTAIKAFKKALLAKPNDTIATEQLTKAKDAKLKEDETKERNFQAALKEGDFVFEQAMKSQLADDFEKAWKAYEKALTFKSDPVVTEKKTKAELEKGYWTAIAEGTTALGQKKWRDAQTTFQKALNKKANDERARSSLRSTMVQEIEANMVLIVGDTFQMGEDISGRKKDPGHEVSLQSFSISRFEITRNQYRYFTGETTIGYNNCSQCPVEELTYQEIQNFLKILSKETGANYRLPTEAEWEFAARGGSKSQHASFSGSNNSDAVAHYSKLLDKKRTAQAVGQNYPNELDLYDMSGNVAEWCSDWFAPYDANQKDNPKGPNSGREHIIRGGGYGDKSDDCTVFVRRSEVPTKALKGVGFRIVISK